jgi:hypothetical protein
MFSPFCRQMKKPFLTGFADPEHFGRFFALCGNFLLFALIHFFHEMAFAMTFHFWLGPVFAICKGYVFFIHLVVQVNKNFETCLKNKGEKQEYRNQSRQFLFYSSKLAFFLPLQDDKSEVLK